MKSEQEAVRAIELYGDMVRRICLIHLKNHADTEDIFQTVFLKYLLYPSDFQNAGHEKAWFIRVSIKVPSGRRRSPWTAWPISLPPGF